MKEENELLHQSTEEEAIPVVIDPWDAVGVFVQNGLKMELHIDVYMDEDGYEILPIDYIRTIADVENKIVKPLPTEFSSTGSTYKNNDYAIFVQLVKNPASGNVRGKERVKTPLFWVNPNQGKPFYIALHVEGKSKKYRRKSEASVSSQNPAIYANAAVG